MMATNIFESDHSVWVGLTAVIVTSVLNWIQSRHNSTKLKVVKEKVEQVAHTQVETKTEIDGRLTELVEAIRAASYAEGRLEGIEVQKRRHAVGDQGAEDKKT